MIRFTVSEKDHGKRIDLIVSDYLGDDFSRSYVKKLIRSSLVKVNYKTVKAKKISSVGDIVELELIDRQVVEYPQAEDISIEVIYEDENIVAVNKSPGMVVHPAPGNWSGTLVNALLHKCDHLALSGRGLRPGIVHRLDKDTSGIILVAKDDRSLEKLKEQFRRRRVEKYYLALVHGELGQDTGEVNAPVARHFFMRKKMAVLFTGGKKALTEYKVLERCEGFSFLRLKPQTGRTHQIRVHMAHIGHPLLGDTKYGGKKVINRQALHAERIVFEHPLTGERMDLVCPMPLDMQRIIDGKKI